jgi:cephalosporin hydroxylase
MEREGRKYEHYFIEYEDKFKNVNPARILEIGVQSGKSLLYWRNMFPDAEIVGVDIDSNCLKFSNQNENIKVIIGDQENVDFLNSLGDYDIIIDDGGHTINQQLVTFNTMFPKLSSGGWYVIEDLHTSYWPQFGGEKDAFTTIEFLKTLVDDINATYAIEKNNNRCDKNFKIKNRFGIESITFIESVVFIKKQKEDKNYNLPF